MENDSSQMSRLTLGVLVRCNNHSTESTEEEEFEGRLVVSIYTVSMHMSGVKVCHWQNNDSPGTIQYKHGVFLWFS